MLRAGLLWPSPLTVQPDGRTWVKWWRSAELLSCCYSCCCCSIVKSCLTFCSPWIVAHQAPLPSSISQSLLKFMSTEIVMLSNYLIFCCPLLLLPSIFPSIRVFSNESTLCIKYPKYWSISFSISPFIESSGLISFRIDWFDFMQPKRLSRVFCSTTVRSHQFFGVQPSL